jgi:hypothetical protein
LRAKLIDFGHVLGIPRHRRAGVRLASASAPKAAPLWRRTKAAGAAIAGGRALVRNAPN